MTTDDARQARIETAAKIIYNALGARAGARALDDAGMLADPGEPYDQLDNQRNLWAQQCREAEARAERAEAELAELRAAVERVRALRDNWARLAGQAIDSDTREWVTAAARSLANEAAELNQMVARFRTDGAASAAPVPAEAIAFPKAKARPRPAAKPRSQGNLAVSASPDHDDWTEF